MSEFQELVKSLAKSREYVRDFYIYGFKSREDFDNKSPRTYDNERRRMESWLASYIRSCYHKNVKTVSLSLNTNLLSVNPLCRIFEAKSFTNNDILLHFYLLDILQADCFMTADALSDAIMDRFQADIETQLVRKKANEYVAEGILQTKKQGKRVYYFRSAPLPLPDTVWQSLMDAVCFYQIDAPLGFVGYSLIKHFDTTNTAFCVKHGYFVHVLEDEILLPLLLAINEHRDVLLKVQSNKPNNHKYVTPKADKKSDNNPADSIQTHNKRNRSNLSLQPNVQTLQVLPLRIMVSTRTGRRYLCVRRIQQECFYHIRLDHIKEVTLMSENTDFAFYQQKLTECLPHCFGVCFGNSSHMDENESYYHGLVAGLFSPMKGYRTKSNREAGKGRSDLFIKPVSRRKQAFVVEFKVAKRPRELEKKAEEALKQIQDRQYAAELLDDGYEYVGRYGIAFCGKDCLVKFQE